VDSEHVVKDKSVTHEKVLIKGAGEQASATAHRLFRCGFRVVMTDLERPMAVRRTVSFCSAIPDREIEIEGVLGVAHQLEQAEVLEEFDWSHIPVFVDPSCRLRAIWKPEVIIDARIAKSNLDNNCGDAELVIGLGPGLEAGRDVHFVVETHRGHDLGRIIARGTAASNTGQPGDIGGYTHERVLIAPRAGVFESRRAIGSLVRAGDVIGEVGGERISAQILAGISGGVSAGVSAGVSGGVSEGVSAGISIGVSAGVSAGISGVIRGLLASGSEVAVWQKLGDIDPRGDPSFCHTLSDKGRTISGSVLEVVIRHVREKSKPTP
jgi:xanthine dehydrogenase accessory factor